MDRESVRQLSAEQFDTGASWIKSSRHWQTFESLRSPMRPAKRVPSKDAVRWKIDTICKTLRISRSTFYRYVRL